MSIGRLLFHFLAAVGKWRGGLTSTLSRRSVAAGSSTPTRFLATCISTAYCTTTSTRDSTDCGIVRPMDFAVRSAGPHRTRRPEDLFEITGLLEQSVMASAPCDEAAEDRAVLEVVAGGVVRGVALHPLADGLAGRHVEARNLALVAHQRGDLTVDGATHVHDDLRLVGAPEPQLTHLVRLKGLPGYVLGEVQVVARVRIHGILGDDARLAMVAMLEALRPERIVDEHDVRPVTPERPHHVPQEGAGVLELAVGIAEHDQVLHAHEVGGRALLPGPPLRELIRREGAIGGARVAVGAEDIRDLAAGGDPLGDDAPGADLRIVGMGEDDHGAFRNLGHELELAGSGGHDAYSTRAARLDRLSLPG